MVRSPMVAGDNRVAIAVLRSINPIKVGREHKVPPRRFEVAVIPVRVPMSKGKWHNQMFAEMLESAITLVSVLRDGTWALHNHALVINRLREIPCGSTTGT